MTVHKDENAKKNKWYFVFYTGEVKNGVRERIKRRGFKTQKEAVAAEAEARTSVNKGDFIEYSKILFEEYLVEWLKNKRNVSEETRELYGSFFKIYIIPLLGSIPLVKINATHIDNFLTNLKDRGLAESTIKRVFSVVNASLNAAATKDLILKNPCNKVDKPTVSRRNMVVWEPEYAFDFLEKTKGKSRYWIAIYLAIMTGMRQGEILGLRWSDIDLDNKTLHIQQTVTRKRRIKAGAKSDSSIRSVALSSDTIKTLKEQRQFILQERMLLGKDYQDHDLVVCTSFGGPATSRSVAKVWEKFIKTYEVRKITFHDLRHTHVSMLIKQKVHIKIISERLGHASVSITMDLYGHLLPNMQEDAAESIDSLNWRVQSTKE